MRRMHQRCVGDSINPKFEIQNLKLNNLEPRNLLALRSPEGEEGNL